MKRILTFLIATFIFQSIGIGQIVINEYSTSNLNRFYDSFFKTEDWVELYNAGTETVDISGWHLSDKLDKPEKWEIPQGVVLGPGEYRIVYCSGRDGDFDGELHAGFKLSQTTGKDVLVLSDASGNILESHELNITLVEHSNCRSEDGGDTWMICTAPTFGGPNGAAPQFARYTSTPTSDLEGGFYSGSQVVTLTNNEENSTLRYTLTGDNPTETSPIYTGPITISTTTVVKAQAFSDDPTVLTGKMVFNTYFIDEEYSLAVFSVAADEVINLANGQGELIPVGSIEYFNVDGEREATSYGSLNRHGQDSWVLDHRSLDWISRDEMGYSKAVFAELFSYSDRDEYQKFMFRNSGDDNYPAIDDFAHEGSTHIRDEFVQTLALEGNMKLDTRGVERVVVYLNGKYWGVYGMRDRPVDHDYTDFYYDQGKYDIQYLSTWGSTEIEYGGFKALNDWRTLRDFILKSDMSLEENYKIAEDSINLISLIDYMIVNLNVVASDWLNYNTGWWRGLNPDGDHKKWGYILWDLDATFDYYINYSGVPNTDPDAVPCDLEQISNFMDGFFGNEDPNAMTGGDDLDPEACSTILNGISPYPATDSIFNLVINQDPYCCDTDWDNICQDLYDQFESGSGGSDPSGFLEGDIGRHESIFLKLLDENETFRQLYYSRYADMMNTVFTCENMNTTLDRMLDVIRPEMPRQIQRWGGSMKEWEQNVERLKDFINERCTLLDNGMIECYDELSGPHQLTLMAEPEGIGEIDLNTLDIEEFPWSGDYFAGMENSIKARVFNKNDEEWEFSHWESTAGSMISPDLNTRKATIMLEQPDTLTAVFRPKTVSTTEVEDGLEFNVYPNPTNDHIMVDFTLEKPSDVRLTLYSMLGEKVSAFTANSGRKSQLRNSERLDLSALDLRSGLYVLLVEVDEMQRSFKVNVVRE